jgi:Kdo2-lipid IVA lauroyltransferase/acyltransferase
VFILVDQKLNTGLSVPFLGHSAMTTSTLPRLCQKFACPLVPVRVKRQDKNFFTVTFCNPISVDKDDYSVTHKVNDIIGEWVKDSPEQWMWVHKRWPFS